MEQFSLNPRNFYREPKSSSFRNKQPYIQSVIVHIISFRPPDGTIDKRILLLAMLVLALFWLLLVNDNVAVQNGILLAVSQLPSNSLSPIIISAASLDFPGSIHHSPPLVLVHLVRAHRHRVQLLVELRIDAELLLVYGELVERRVPRAHLLQRAALRALVLPVPPLQLARVRERRAVSVRPAPVRVGATVPARGATRIAVHRVEAPTPVRREVPVPAVIPPVRGRRRLTLSGVAPRTPTPVVPRIPRGQRALQHSPALVSLVGGAPPPSRRSRVVLVV